MKYLATFLLLAFTIVTGYLLSILVGRDFPLFLGPLAAIVAIVLAAVLTAVLLARHPHKNPSPSLDFYRLTPNPRDDIRFVFFIYLQTLTCGLQANAIFVLTGKFYFLAAIPPLIASILASLIAIPFSLLLKPTPWKTPSHVFALLHLSFLILMLALFTHASSKKPGG